MPVGIELDLTLPRDLSTVPRVRHVLKHTLREFGVTESCVDDVELAVSEACANVVEHARGKDQYAVNLTVDDHCCRIRVVDTGHGFDGPIADAFPTHDAERGRGLLIMRSLMDSLKFRSTSERCTVVELTKRLEFDGNAVAGPGDRT